MPISHITTCYHERVPIQIGSHIIDHVTSCITEKELQSLSQSWKIAYVSTILSKSSQVSYQHFNLYQVRDEAVTTKNVKIPTLQTVVAEGLTQITGHQKCVHVLVDPSPKCTSVFVLRNTSELVPRKSSVAVVF